MRRIVFTAGALAAGPTKIARLYALTVLLKAVRLTTRARALLYYDLGVAQPQLRGRKTLDCQAPLHV